jgi:alkylation response protein AidB-like acyl-CoA dehydrogenase
MADEHELELLRASVRGAVGAGAGLSELGEMGLLGLLVPEELGGAGWRPVEAVAVAIELGRSTGDRGSAQGADAPSDIPWLEASVAALALSSADESVRREWLAPLLAGSRSVVIADGRAHRAGDGLSGVMTGVVGRADAAVVPVDGQWLLVERKSTGVAIADDPASIDVALPAELWSLSGVGAVELGPPEGRTVDPVDVRRVLAAGSLLGLLSAALERLVPYLSERVAFGSHIASFQAIQHRIVDLFLLEVRSRVTVEAAARALGERAERAATLAVVAHGFVAAQVPGAIDECIQLTGGIGFTWEYQLHHELRRAVALAASCGGTAESRRRFALQGAGHG